MVGITETNTRRAIVAVVFALGFASPAHAICDPAAPIAGKLLIVDVSACGTPSDSNFCRSELTVLGESAAALDCRSAREAQIALDSTLVAGGRAGVSALIEPRGREAAALAAGMFSARANFQAGSGTGSMIPEFDAEMWAALLAGLGLTAFQMRRRRGTRVVTA